MVLEHKPDDMVITETWLHQNILDAQITPLNYTIIRKDKGARGGGVTILIRSDMTFTVLDEVKDVETLQVQIKLSDRNVVLCRIYRPPNSSVDISLFATIYGLGITS